MRAMQAPDTGLGPRESKRRDTIKNCDEVCIEWNCDNGVDNLCGKSTLQAKLLIPMYKSEWIMKKMCAYR
jgi:hypothetical protein